MFRTLLILATPLILAVLVLLGSCSQADTKQTRFDPNKPWEAVCILGSEVGSDDMIRLYCPDGRHTFRNEKLAGYVRPRTSIWLNCTSVGGDNPPQCELLKPTVSF